MPNSWEGKLHPRLRVIYNGGDFVNACRAAVSLCVTSTLDIKAGAPPDSTIRDLERFAAAAPAVAGGASLARGPSFAPVPSPRGAALSPKEAPAAKRQVTRPTKRRKIDAVGRAEHAFVNIIVETQPAEPGEPNPLDAIRAAIERASRRVADPDGQSDATLPRRGFISAKVPVAALQDIASLPGVRFVHEADALSFRLPSPDHAAVDREPAYRAVKVAGREQSGEGVLVGIIDVGGFDFGHPEFLDDDGDTRFIAIWDQGGDYRSPPDGFRNGSELTEARLKAAVKNQNGWPAYLVERQSQTVSGSHGTHVASIAAGRHGVCPKALIAGVLIDVPLPEGYREQRQWTFVDSAAIIQAVEYLANLATARDLALVVNISLGTNGGSHDGANGTCRWLDSFLATPGRAICAAAGNAGQERGVASDDLGWITGRIHASGRVASRGLDVDLEWVVVGDGIADASENELELWYGPQDRLTISILPPGETAWHTVQPGEYIENRRLTNGTVLSIYNEVYHPVNGDNYVGCYLSPNFDPVNFSPVASGIWKVRLHGDEIRDGRFHGWIERDDPAEMERINGLRAFRFPSFFSERSNVDSHSISSLACSHRIIAVANADDREGRINISSSQGPTRDDRQKPEVAAPGTQVIAAHGFDTERRWVAMTGTSMSSPYVCGVVGLMLAANRTLTAAQCQGILKRTARPLPSLDYTWRNDTGYGLLDPVAAIAEAATIGLRKSL